MEKEEPSTQQPSLPAELLCEIISLCKPASLLNLCLANTVFRDIASPSLYKRLSFSSPTQAEAFVHAVSSSLSLFLSLLLSLLRTHTTTVPQKQTAS
jgi:energy-coupling factor transporter transmembrane protein EcfT